MKKCKETLVEEMYVGYRQGYDKQWTSLEKELKLLCQFFYSYDKWYINS